MQEVLLKIAPPYDAAEVERIRQGFEKLLGQPVTLRVEEDRALIGGFTAYVEGKVYDASMRAKLTAFRQSLGAAHGGETDA